MRRPQKFINGLFLKSSNNSSRGLIEIGRIVRSHGLTGRMKVQSHLESPGVLHDLSMLYVGRDVSEAVPYPTIAAEAGKDCFILKLDGIGNRDEALNLVGCRVWIPCEKMQKLPEGEYYWFEIVGLRVITEDNRSLGRIEAVFPTGGNDVYVCRGDEGEILIPAIEEVVKQIDTERGVMVVRLLKGLC